MGGFLCKQRRGLTAARAQRRKKLQQQRGDCLLRAPCMLCFLLREPVPPAQDCASLQLRNSLPADMVCKRKTSGDNQQPGTPCKQPRCSTEDSTATSAAGDHGHPSTQHHQGITPTSAGGHCHLPTAGDHGHPSTQHHQGITPSSAGGQCHPQTAGDHGHPSTQHHQGITPTSAGGHCHPQTPGDLGHPSTQHHQCIIPTSAGGHCHPPTAGDHGHPSTQHHQGIIPTSAGGHCHPPTAGDHGHPSTQHHQGITPTSAGGHCHPLTAGDHGHPSTQHHQGITPTSAGSHTYPSSAGDHGHPSTQHHQGITPTSAGGHSYPSAAGDCGHPSTHHHQGITPTIAADLDRTHPSPGGHTFPSPAEDQGALDLRDWAHQPSLNPVLEYAKKDGRPLPEDHPQLPTSETGGSSMFSSQDQLHTLGENYSDPQKMEDEQLNINQLPPSLLLKIFSHLSLNKRCLCVSLVCKYWRDLCLDFQFWKHLDLSSRCQVKDDTLEKISSRFRNISELNISDCLNVTDAGVGVMAARCPGLVKYTGYRCKQLSDSSLIALATHCTSLQKVHVGNQDRLSDEAIKQLGSRCKDLRDIHFGQCYKISDEGMISIAEGCSKLKKIYMQENKLDKDPKHTSRLCTGYLTKKDSDGVLCQMTWPPQSPDLNPIMMVWSELDRRVKAKGPSIMGTHLILLEDHFR
ncbi:F-box/LRR-repeat protein 17 isoform X4 [Engystomops pustulosus]|uniref:F-box/LRR-repeat protein 17 isoform X4 n=1 Tax=Engystomops pustulosus TaxID=76066 RepID=UPI003AFA95B8